MTKARKLVTVVDDDESVRESLPDLFKACGLEVSSFASAEEFLDSRMPGEPDCLVLDVAMPGMSGPELQQKLLRLGRNIPTVFITAHADEFQWPRLLTSGAVACLLKPFSENAILESVNAALRGKGGC